jgi:hypothetical protein
LPSDENQFLAVGFKRSNVQHAAFCAGSSRFLFEFLWPTDLSKSQEKTMKRKKKKKWRKWPIPFFRHSMLLIAPVCHVRATRMIIAP